MNDVEVIEDPAAAAAALDPIRARLLVPTPANASSETPTEEATIMTDPNVPLRMELDIELPGTPAQIWQAIATSSGLAAWFVPTDVDGRVGGRIVTRMGPSPEEQIEVR